MRAHTVPRTRSRFRSIASVLGVGIGLLALAPASALAGNAVYTTNATDGTCLNGSGNAGTVNCNVYADNGDVYLSGGPANGGKALADGNYFFAILEPGAQANPTDGAAGNLSTSDHYADREFNVTGGVVTNLGTHANTTLPDGRLLIQAMPYAETTNPGGVYIVAVCKWLGDTPGANDATTASTCHYDAFKIKSSTMTPPGQASDPVVTKDATATFKRTFTWGVTKSVDKTLFQQLSGSVTAHYTIDATKSAGVDSAWVVKGTITVFNPNDGGSLTLTGVQDNIGDPNATCTVDTTAGLTVAAQGTTQYPYECDYGAAPDPANILNTATASWDQQTIGTDSLPASTGDGFASFSFDDGSTDNPKLVDNCATITDTLDGSTITLGDPCATTEYTPSTVFPVPASGCVNHGNTAAFTTDTLGLTGSSSTVTVRVCGPVGGEGTMGFWTNKNGQAVITNSSSTVGVCDAGTYLRNYAPFQDLTAGSTCKQVAAYVTKIITAANASGAAMNAMLKAQMLSTALDVRLGNVPGNVNVDLTKICKSATSCTSYEDTSGAFGGTPKTVNELLAWAASQSNLGGSAWYGQVKATQGLAKDTFDAINNGVALSI